MHLKTGGMGKTIRIQYSVIQFFFNPYMDKGLKTRKKGIGYFVMYFLLLYYIYLYIFIYIDI